MTLVFIYGPVAAGKLTVATELAARTGFALLHNHDTFDVVIKVRPWDTPGHVELLERVRLDLIEAAAEDDRDLIVTDTTTPDLPSFALRVRAIAESYGGRACFVHLFAETSALEARILATDRHRYQKARDPVVLREMLDRPGYAGVLDDDDLSIDNTFLGPEEVAEMVTERYGFDGRQ